MENIILTVHLILALLLIGVVLLQRSEGGGLGMGGSSGGGVMTGRQAANALSKLTWVLAGLFLVTSVVLTLLASHGQGTGSILDRLAPAATQSAPATPGTPAAPAVELPPPAATDAPATPPAADAPATPPASN